MTRSRKDRLGKGLGALLGEYLGEEAPSGEVRRVPLQAIVPNPLQPRREFSEDELVELAESIRENGLLQPLVVRPAPGAEGRFELVAGERRLRAIRSLEWEDVAAVIREVSDETLLVLALVENLQREALNPLEEAEGYQTLADSFGLTQEEIAHSVGKDRSTVANMLRLLGLPPSVRKLLEAGELSMGHGRALLGVDDPVKAGELARRAASEGWSVREVERRVRGRQEGRSDGSETKKESASRSTSSGDPVLQRLQEELRATLGTRVRVRGGRKGRGTIEIPFAGSEDFERLFALLTGREASDVVA